jgi:peptidoglycan/xylan/chitin deacetylase (PgdA/CDA1 family)
MGADDLARLARSGRITVGSHTVNHAALSALPEHQQLFELGESRRQLESITGRPVCDVSYPHGSASVATRRLAQQSGYRSACGSTQDVVSRASDRFSLPRFWIPDWDGDRFARWLHRWQT